MRTKENAAGLGRGFRLALMLGFGGMLGLFLFAGADAVRLLRDMRAENKILRDASQERSRRLASVRSYVLLSHNYVDGGMIAADKAQSEAHLQELRGYRAAMDEALGSYQPETLDELLLLKQLKQLLDIHWQRVSRIMAWSAEERRKHATSASHDDVAPLVGQLLQITSGVENTELQQSASTEAAIEKEFEAVGGRLGSMLQLSLFAALVWAGATMIYILRIERQDQRRYAEIVDARAEMTRLSARLVAAQEEERRKIARELHDEVGQSLNAVLVEAANLARHLPQSDPDARACLDSIRAQADSSVNSIRDIALLLRPSMLDDLGLIPALEWQAREVSRRGAVKVRVAAENVPESLDDAVRTCIYRIVQEALHNISSHAHATQAVVTVRSTPNELQLVVEDDGSGFDPSRTRGLGLLGMEERVKQLGGRLEIQSQPGKGAVLSVTLPSLPPAVSRELTELQS